jgi:fucose 4-O-acetylase-like acetyltransferase
MTIVKQRMNGFKTNRALFIDIAKGICIILVVIGHYLPESYPPFAPVIHHIRGVIYCFHMPLFMFASGYVYWITRKKESYRSFIRKKFFRLALPYLGVSVLVIVIKLMTEKGLYLENPVSFSSFYEMFYLPVAGYFLWFVYTLFIIFMIVPLFGTEERVVWLFVLSAVLFFLPVDFPDVFCLKELKDNIVYFSGGCIAARYGFVRGLIRWKYVCMGAVVFAGLYLLRNAGYEMPVVARFISFILSVCGIIFVLGISSFMEKNGKIFLNLSVYSYTVYLFHTTFQGFAKAIFARLPIEVFIGDPAAFIM